MRTYTYFLSVILATLYLVSCGESKNPERLDPKSLVDAAQEMNKNFPAMIDSQTEMTRVEASAAGYIYHVRMVNWPTAILDNQWLVRAQDLVARRNCADPTVRYDLDSGLLMTYIYHGSDGGVAGRFIISNVLCQQRGY